MRSYEYALLEIDRSKLPHKIQVAEAAISARFVELSESPDLEEPNAIRKALRVLDVVRKHERWIKGDAKDQTSSDCGLLPPPCFWAGFYRRKNCTD